MQPCRGQARACCRPERCYFFDLGVRHAAAELPLDEAAIRANPGPIFEHWVGIELWKRLQYLGGGTLQYLRTKAGAEVDFIIARGGRLIPIEVKWTESPSVQTLAISAPFSRNTLPRRRTATWSAAVDILCGCTTR